jgi:FkbM family methyltransferase
LTVRHRIFERFAEYEGWTDPGFERGYYGLNVRDWLFTGESKGYTERRVVRMPHPPLDEEYFEWVALMAAICHSRGRFCMAEVGAGWGRWMGSAAVLCRQKGVDFALVGIEAEPSHFEWMKMALRDNDIDPDDHTLFQAAVAGDDGELILAGPDAPLTQYGHRTIQAAELTAWRSIPDYVFRSVPAYSLKTLLAAHERFDLIDLDVQGTEYDILAPSFETLNSKVGVVHVGTHSTEVEELLSTVFRANGWLNAFSYPSRGDVNTLFGRVKFSDGVQTWVNPAQADLLPLLLDA